MAARSTRDTEASCVLTTNTCRGAGSWRAPAADVGSPRASGVAAARARNSRRVVMAISSRPSLAEVPHPEVVEGRLGVRLGPEADPAGLGNGRVRGFDQLLPVQRALDAVADHPDGQRVPLAGGELDPLLAAELRPLACDDVVEPVVVLQRVVAGD